MLGLPQRVFATAFLAALPRFGTQATAQPSTQDLYDTPERQAAVTVNLGDEFGVIPKELFGVNLSYFNDIDTIWAAHGIAQSLATAGVGALRYPGGEETSFYSWRHPGVNGYEDIHADPTTHGDPPNRGPFQVTWVDPSEWASNESFMSFDEFMEHCLAMDAEPFVGINMSSGRAHNRAEECLEDALALVRHATERWGIAGEGGVRYWFLDNEPWHGKAAYTFDIEREYVPDVVRYSRAIKAIDPDAEIVVNPFSGESYNFREYAVRVIRAMGNAIDHIDVHWYPGWGISTWELWAGSPAMNTGTKWKPREHHRTFAEDFELLRGIFAEAGRPDLGLMALEWNIGPSTPLVPLSDEAFALMHAEMLMTFIGGELEAACLWTNLWRSKREVWPEQDLFPTLHDQQPPFGPTRSHDAFRMLSQLAGCRRIAASSDATDLLVTAARADAGEPIVVLLNKSSMRRRITINLDPGGAVWAWESESFGVRRSDVYSAIYPPDDDGTTKVYVEPYSLSVVRGALPSTNDLFP
ncbi:MAG: hypothetical protein AAGB51_04865 [Planctomycetota bacterium]